MGENEESPRLSRFEGVFFGAAKLLYENADYVEDNRKSHPLLLAIAKEDRLEVLNQLSGEKLKELFEYVTDYVSPKYVMCMCCIKSTLNISSSRSVYVHVYMPKFQKRIGTMHCT
jgi:hypothetical protein